MLSIYFTGHTTPFIIFLLDMMESGASFYFCGLKKEGFFVCTLIHTKKVNSETPPATNYYCRVLEFQLCVVCLLSACGVTTHCEEEEEEKRGSFAYKGHKDLFLLQKIL